MHPWQFWTIVILLLLNLGTKLSTSKFAGGLSILMKSLGSDIQEMMRLLHEINSGVVDVKESTREKVYRR